MTFEQFKLNVFEYAKKSGINECEIVYKNGYEFDLGLGNGELDKYSDAGSYVINLKVLKNGKLGKSFTETMESPEKLVEEAISNLNIIESKEEAIFHDGTGEYKVMDIYNNEISEMSVTERMNFMNNAYKGIKEDNRIKNVPRMNFGYFSEDKIIANTKGLNVSYKRNGAFAWGMATTTEENPHSGMGIFTYTKPETMKSEEMAEKIKGSAIEKINSQSVPSGKYKIIIKNETIVEMLSLITFMISAENVNKGISPLKDKLNQKVGSDKVTLIDKPYYSGSISNIPFDSEGVPTTEKTIFENGVLKTFIYDLKNAKINNSKSTGNATENGISTINFYFKEGTKSYDELIKHVQNGLVITEVQGLHSGANPISGNFSLGASGLLIEEGVITRGVEQITISGNLIDMLGKIEETGNDLYISYDGYIAPSIVISEIDVAGEK